MRILLPMIFLCAVAFGEDGMIAIKSNKPDTVIQVRKEITNEGKTVPLWVNIGITPKDGSYVLLKMPIGVQRIKLSKDGYLPIITNVTVDKKINKIEYELDTELIDMNIIFLPEGWQVYVDGNPYLDDNKPVFAPTTIRVSKEKHEIRLVKDGYNDIMKDMVNTETMEIKDEPVRGKKTIVKKAKPVKLIEEPKVSVVGTWKKIDTGTILQINSDGTVLVPRAINIKYTSGKWILEDKNFTLIYGDERILMNMKRDDFMEGRWSLQKLK
jgi:hypothetical protein